MSKTAIAAIVAVISMCVLCMCCFFLAMSVAGSEDFQRGYCEELRVDGITEDPLGIADCDRY